MCKALSFPPPQGFVFSELPESKDFQEYLCIVGLFTPILVFEDNEQARELAAKNR